MSALSLTGGGNQVLALTSSKVPLVYQNPLAQYVTNLPYIDEEPEPRFMNKASQMVQEEMRNMAETDYLQNMPVPDFEFESSDRLKKEYERIVSQVATETVKTGATIPPKIDIENEKDPKKLEKAADSYSTLLEHKNIQ